MISNVYNCDCLEYMRTLPDKHFSLAIVDPPYGINAGNCYGETSKKPGKSKAYKTVYKISWDNNIPEKEYFEQLLRISKNQIIWGINYYKVQDLLGAGRIFWDKNNGKNDFSDGELAYQSFTQKIRKVEITWNGMIQQDMKNKEERIHPTQKPIALYNWLLTNYAKSGDTIFDTHLGSGSSRISSHDLGFDFVGCELDKDYFNAAEKRYQNHIKQQVLFAPENKIVKQTTLL